MATPTVKLSKAMIRVLVLVEHHDYQIAYSGDVVRGWIQSGGVGSGGRTEKIHGNTFAALLDRELITRNRRRSNGGLIIYRLTPKGKKSAPRLFPRDLT